MAPYNDDGRKSGGDRGDRKDRGGRPYKGGSSRGPYKGQRDGSDRRGYKPRDGDRNGSGGDRRKEYRPRDDRGRSEGGYRPRDRDSDRKPYRPRDDRRPRDGDRKDRDDRSGGYRKDYKPREDRGSSGYRPRDDRPRDDRKDYRRKEYRPREEYRDEEPVPEKLTIPSDPQKILFKGIDCEVNGRTDLAMILYLNGAVRMSKGCESNALKMLRNANWDELAAYKERAEMMCSVDAIVELEYLLLSIGEDGDRSLLDSEYEKGSCHAQYCRIRLGEIEGDDPMIQDFIANAYVEEAKVIDGLTYLKRRKDSKAAEKGLAKIEQNKKLKQSVRTEFLKAYAGDEKAVSRLEELTKNYPEAEFLLGCVRSEDPEEYLRTNFQRYPALIVSLGSELRFESAFGTFLRAKKLQADDGDWIQSMINAAVAGSEEAVEELRPVQSKPMVRKAFETVYLRKGDAEGLVRMFDGEDTSALDQYCSLDPEKVVAVGKLMNREREIDWLKRNYRKGMEECRKAIEAMVADEERHTKLLVYALHDVGSDLESAKLYFAMEGDPALPSYKWLAKVCEDEAAKQYVQSQFEKKGDMETFESIFIDDGYQKKSSGGRSGGKGRGGRPDRRRY